MNIPMRGALQNIDAKSGRRYAKKYLVEAMQIGLPLLIVRIQ
jgi:hypothetical protein